MTEDFLISVIVPVHNTENYIGRCLSSLVNQTYGNIEIICIDDGSVDNSLKILEEFAQKDSRITVFRNETSKGPATSRNIGLDNAHGYYIMFCDDDDYYKPEMCEKMVNYMSEYKADFASCRSDFENENFNASLAKYTNTNPVGYYVLDNKIRAKINVLIWNKIFKKSLIDKYNIRFPDGLSGEDDAFIFQYTAISETYFGGGEYLHIYSILREGSFNMTVIRGIDKKHRYDKIDVVKYCVNFAVTRGIFSSVEDYLKRFIKNQLSYIYTYNTRFIQRLKVALIYNFYILSVSCLDYKSYRFSEIFWEGRRSLKNIIGLLKKCTWRY